ncbi:MAG TPA: hypothetical protein VEN99_01130, partial [Acidimicrobiia bacterium]|nr:hypothetical protein [Acidimicrobiia bacterium]
SATTPTGGPRGEGTYLGPAGTAANQAVASATPAVGTVQDQTAKLDLTAVPSPQFQPGSVPNEGQAWVLRRPRIPFLE